MILPNKLTKKSEGSNHGASSRRSSENEMSPGDLRQGISDLVFETLEDHNVSIEKRVKSLEQVLFKTSQADRNRLFDHIYEKIAVVEKRVAIDSENLHKSMHRQEKRTEMITLQADTQREQSQLTQSMCRQIAQDIQKQSDKVRKWYDEFMSKVNVQNKVLFEELDRIRGRMVTAESADITLS